MSDLETTSAAHPEKNLQNRENGSEVGAINIAPTWGEVGLLFWRLAMSGERAAVEQMRSEVARAFAGMEVLSRLKSTLTPEQRAVFDEVWQVEQAKVLR